jgi:hypothetical protein
MILLYPYPHQIVSLILGAILVSAIGFPLYAIYKLITRRMDMTIKTRFNKILILLGIAFGVLFFTELVIALITEHQVNQQLGFRYATPDTPEGELFIITRIETGSIMDKSGLQVDDQIRMFSTADLYKLIIDNQGKEILIPIERDQSEMNIRVPIPEMELTLLKLTFTY